MYKSHQIIGYADDLAVIARSEEGLKDIIQKLINEAWQRGLLQVNEKKSKITKIEGIKKDRAEFRVCTYLGEQMCLLFNRHFEFGLTRVI